MKNNLNISFAKRNENNLNVSFLSRILVLFERKLPKANLYEKRRILRISISLEDILESIVTVNLSSTRHFD